MNSGYLLKTKQGQWLYNMVANMPIIDYHCHLSPKEIYEDKSFDNIGQMWLSGDHYKWRLMRSFGVDERYITGEASWYEKFEKYIHTLSSAAGNPLYHWTQMELAMYFGIEKPLNIKNAKEIWEAANAVIKEKELSPRKLILSSKVEFIATTDDVTDSLEYHQKLKNLPFVIAPSFRTDNLLLIRRAGFADYINKLSQVSGVEITGIESFMKAICKRLDFFCENGCRFSDIGIEYFPDHISSKEQADDVFKKALAGEAISNYNYLGFIGFMFLFLAAEYKERNVAMQWHLAVKRNANTSLFQRLGADCGGDCIGDVIPNSDIIRMLDAINTNSGLPKTIIYTLNPSMSYSLSTIAGSFPNVVCGAAWWFCDTKQGIANQIKTIAETGHIGTFMGMLTDSRSFLSYARHDYFRRILCDIIGEWVEGGEFDSENAVELVKNICYNIIKGYING